MRRRRIEDWSRCLDCKQDTHEIGQYYMVHDEVWAASGLGKEDGMLCIDCLQGRIGRWLTVDDFLPTDKSCREFWGGDRMLPRAFGRPGR